MATSHRLTSRRPSRRFSDLGRNYEQTPTSKSYCLNSFNQVDVTEVFYLAFLSSDVIGSTECALMFLHRYHA